MAGLVASAGALGLQRRHAVVGRLLIDQDARRVTASALGTASRSDVVKTRSAADWLMSEPLAGAMETEAAASAGLAPWP